MRAILVTALAVAALACVLLPPATQAKEYAFCGSGLTDCSYTTLAQCKAAVSGTPGDCTPNPRYRAPRYIKRKVYD
jgi:hypothetical protein